MDNGIKCETVKVKNGYKARIAIYENGKRLYTVLGEVVLIARGDALKEAFKMAHDLRVANFLNGEEIVKEVV